MSRSMPREIYKAVPLAVHRPPVFSDKPVPAPIFLRRLTCHPQKKRKQGCTSMNSPFSLCVCMCIFWLPWPWAIILHGELSPRNILVSLSNCMSALQSHGGSLAIQWYRARPLCLSGHAVSHTQAHPPLQTQARLYQQ